MDEIYSSVLVETSAQLKIEGSRFIADVFPANSEDESRSKLDSIRKKYFDATHHCFAYVIGVEKKITRYSDDGEPSGTAGVKIHSAIRSKSLSDVLIVVTRYFGGTKLGVGGLGRAYFAASVLGLSRAKIISKAVIQELRVAFPFSETKPVMNIIRSHNLKQADTVYSENKSIITVHLLPSQISRIQELFIDATRGLAQISRGDSKTVVWK